MIYYLVTLNNNDGFRTNEVEVFLFSNKTDAEAHTIKLVEQRRCCKHDIKILPILLDFELKNPGCTGEYIFV
jgi:hypothetical protein